VPGLRRRTLVGRLTAMRWLLAVTSLEAVCAITIRLPLLSGGHQLSTWHRAGLLVAVAVVPVLVHAAWRVERQQGRHDAGGRIRGHSGAGRAIGPERALTVAAARTKIRIEAMLAQRLLLTAFQPIRDLKTGDVVGVEALTRFIAEPGTTPDVWFADAASVGLGAQMELLAVQTALTAAAELPEHLYVSVNVSPSTCLDLGLAERITECAIPASRIVIELTEHSAVPNYDPICAALASLRSRGVRIAVDDAGSGFASFRHILELKPDLIKLDRDIITGLDTDLARHALCAAVVSFAARTGTKVTAEGIESPAELRTVTDLGMDAAQGYLLGRPSIEPREWARWQTHADRAASSHPRTRGSQDSPIVGPESAAVTAK
jgi:EAL domain-containing protein (putative c-di-GMP-specific phosphodiesterase class I)